MGGAAPGVVDPSVAAATDPDGNPVAAPAQPDAASLQMDKEHAEMLLQVCFVCRVLCCWRVVGWGAVGKLWQCLDEGV